MFNIGSLKQKRHFLIFRCRLSCCWSLCGSPRRAAAAAIRGWGPCPFRPGCTAGGGQLSGPETLCRSLAPPSPHTRQGSPPVDAPCTVLDTAFVYSSGFLTLHVFNVCVVQKGRKNCYKPLLYTLNTVDVNLLDKACICLKKI